MAADWRADRVGSALRGENPTVLRRLPGGFAVIGDLQWLPGYCLLLTATPGVGRLTDLSRPARLTFLTSMDVLAEAVDRACREVVSGFRRTDLEILGNSEDFLHAHVWPRYDWEPAERVRQPVWRYPDEFWTLPSLQLAPQHGALRTALVRHLDELV